MTLKGDTLKRFILLALLATAGACSEDTTAPRITPDRPPTPTFAAAWAPKYPTVPTCVNGNSLPVNEIILHGEVWEGFASNGWVQYAKSPLESSNERTAEVEVYSYQGVNVNTRCRNTTKVLIWTFYDSPSQTPTHNLIGFNNSQKQSATFNPSAFTGIGDGNEILSSSGLWEVGRDHWVVKGYPRQLNNGATVLDTLADTLAVDVMIQYPKPDPQLGGGCPPNQLDVPQCRP